ncbi:hypothetical protein SAMN02745181_2356 [Rubritalea squalenifaciens DSM 18772]|uniref:Rod shape-determining protein MreD n=2 Tax=Rubritalea TaxID=361050 RepID=A0A1M6LCC2_9BACT|nr:hypothetical protein [Rubritalea squalenifaciens]SHJ68814.1 hypothetical protein SAMN02745181_2356 [Rubritalea squalenifaciens DSM 18772]
MIRYHLSILFLVLAACILQQFLPAITALYDARILLLPLVFLCCAVTVSFSPMLVLAFICGFLWDAQNSLGPHGGDPEIYKTPVDTIHFGYSIILYGLMGVLMQGIQPLFRRGIWQVSAILTGIAIFLYLLAEYLLINFIRGEFIFPARVFYQIWITAALTMICSPFVFALLFKLAKAFNHVISYDGLKRRYFKSDPYTLDI